MSPTSQRRQTGPRDVRRPRQRAALELLQAAAGQLEQEVALLRREDDRSTVGGEGALDGRRRLERFGVGEKHLQAGVQPLEGGLATVERLVSGDVVTLDLLAHARALIANPRGVVVDERRQRIYEFGLVEHQIDAADDANALDLQQFCNELTPVLGPSSFQLTWDHGRPKLRFEVTEPVFDKVGELLVKGDGVLKEEEPHVRSACEEVGLEYAELLEMRVHEKVSIRDLLRIQRALRFLAYVRNSFLTREGIDDADAARVLPIDSDRHSFEMILSRFGVSPESCSSALDVMGWTAESDSFLDLLYKPFIFHHGSRVSVPLLTASAVNVVRNTLWSTRKRPRASGEVDLLSEGLKRAFAHTGWRTCSHLKYKHGAREGEVDFLVVAPRGIFFFECKETLHPCSTFELRRTLDHLDDAFDQLDRFQAALADPSFLKELSERLGEDLRGKRMTGSVVLSHWLLSGAPVGNYSIHNCGEVCNFVATGAAALWVRRTKYKVPLRASGPLSEPDLHEFLNVAGRELDALRRAGVPEVVDWRLPGSGTRLQTTHYPFDPLEQLAVLPMLPDAKREEFSALVHRALDADADGDVASELTNLLAGLERYFVSRREQAP